MLAVGLFVLTAGAVLGVVRQAGARADRVEDQRLALDLARTALTRLIVEGFDAAPIGGDASGVVPESGTPVASGFGSLDGWRLTVSSERSQFSGLNRVAVEVARRDGPVAARLVSLVPTARPDRAALPLEELP